MNPFGKGFWWVGVLIVSFLLVFGATRSHAQMKFEGQTLVIGIRSGSYAQDFEATLSRPFEAITGVRLQHKYSGDFVPLIVASPPDDPPVDVCLATSADYALGIGQNVWQSIRYANVENAKRVFPVVNRISPTTEFGVPFDVGIQILMYRKDKVKTEPTSWNDLLRDEFNGKFSIERGYPSWVYVGSYLTGYTPKTKAIYSPEGRNAIVEEMKRLSKRWFFCYEKGPEFIAALDSGGVLIGNYWNGPAASKIQEEIEKKGKATAYGMVFPKEGSVAYLDHLCVVRGSKKRDLAEAYINYAMGTSAQRAFMKRHFQIMTNQEIIKDVPDLMKGFYPMTEEDWRKFDFIDAKTLESLRKELEDRFVKEVLTRG